MFLAHESNILYGIRNDMVYYNNAFDGNSFCCHIQILHHERTHLQHLQKNLRCLPFSVLFSLEK